MATSARSLMAAASVAALAYTLAKLLVPAQTYDGFRVLTSPPPHRASPSPWSRAIKNVYDEDTVFPSPGAYDEFPTAEGGGGYTKFWLFGSESPNTPKVVFVHGWSMPALVWKRQARALAEAGARVLVYDLYGRGYSSAPPGPYDKHLYVRQLEHLLNTVGWITEDEDGKRTSPEINIVGLSMGGGIIAAFADSHVGKEKANIKSLALLAPAGLLKTSEIPLLARLASLPIASDFFTSFPFRFILEKTILTPADQISSPISRSATHDERPQEIASLKANDAAEMQKCVALQASLLPGYIRALLSSVRVGPLKGEEKAYSTIGERLELPVLVIWGTADATVPYSVHRRLIDRIPRLRTSLSSPSSTGPGLAAEKAEGISSVSPSHAFKDQFVTIPQAGHDLPIEVRKEVQAALRDFFGLPQEEDNV